MKLKIYCVSTVYRKILDNLPKYISPLGVGKNLFPSNWLDEIKEKIFPILINIMANIQVFIGCGRIE